MNECPKYNYLTLGYDCSPAAALRGMGLRMAALPFDWIVSEIRSMEICFSENFSRFHTGLHLNHSKTRLIDVYGFEFPHDYPVENEEDNTGSEKCIVSNWGDYYDEIATKYKRRIARFLEIVTSPNPVIVLCRQPVTFALQIKELLNKYYGKSNVIMITSTNMVSHIPYIRACFTEKNGMMVSVGKKLSIHY